MRISVFLTVRFRSGTLSAGSSAYAELRERNIAEINAAFREQFGYDRLVPKQQQMVGSGCKPPPTPTKQAEEAKPAKTGTDVGNC
jgi:hypothetical protein